MDKYINVLFQNKNFITLDDIKDNLVELKALAASIQHTKAKGTRTIRDKAKGLKTTKDALVLLRRILRHKNKALVYSRKNRKINGKWRIELVYFSLF